AEVVSFFGEVNRFEARVVDGAALTPLGPLPAPGLSEGAAVEVLVRPQGLRLRESAGDAAVPGEAPVSRSRLLGPACLLDLEFGSGAPLKARVATRDLPAAQAKVRLYLHPRD